MWHEKSPFLYIIIISERNWWRQYLHVYVNSFINWELQPDPGIASTLIFVLKTFFLCVWNKNDQRQGFPTYEFSYLDI